jgi:membrane associated rhomboid family serine protease
MASIKKLPKVTIILISLFLILFVLDTTIFKGDLFKWGCRKSFDNIQENEWYRLLTGSFFHINLIHLFGNVLAIYFVGRILENKIGSYYFLLIYITATLADSVVWANYSSNAISFGASPGIYALIACILVLHLRKPNLLNLHYNEMSCNYIIWYFFLGNFIGLGGLIEHSLGFSFGIVISMILLLIGIL